MTTQEKGQQVRIAIAQVTSSTQVATNLEIIEAKAREAAAGEAALVVFPEAMMASFAVAARKVAEPLDGPFAIRVREIAARCGIAVALGMFVTGAKHPLNALLVTGPGVEETTYAKLHLYDAMGFKESNYITAGDEPALFSIDGVTVGCAICYDVRFPALFQTYANLGAHLVIVPTSWAPGEGKTTQYQTLCTARAMDSTCFVAGVDQADPRTVGKASKPGVPTGVGGSVVVDPYGKVLATAGSAPEMMFVEIDPAVALKARADIPVLANARFTTHLTQLPSGGQ